MTDAHPAGPPFPVPGPAPTPSSPGTGPPVASALPRGLLILLGLAAGVVTLAGMRQVASILSPIFLALVLTITVHPVRSRIQRLGAPRWLATLVVILGVYAVLIGLVVAFVWGVARLAALLPDYAPQMQATLNDITRWLGSLGIDPQQVGTALQNIDPGRIVSTVGALLSSALGVVSTLVFVITLVLFMGLDGAVFTVRADRFRDRRATVLAALAVFALGTRKYFAVATIFGGIVAALDGLALVLLGVPAAFLWAVLAFVTNYIPNVGFIIGLVPPALLALLAGGVGQMIIVIVVYAVLNFVIQSVIQPKFVGHAVGLTTTVSFLSLIVWSYILGPLGAVLAVPATLLVKAVLVDADADARWLQLFLGDEPDLSPRPPGRIRSRLHPERPPAAPTGDRPSAGPAGLPAVAGE